ncbi:MAG TPA: EAL domain-containing protein [Thermoanaerobaculia bacterium]|nr:EAL domain-containing protein [Thermoanaerobaculia bacterium]
MAFFSLTLAFLAAEVLFVALVILTLFYFRRRFGLTPLFLFIGSQQYLQTVLAATVYLPLVGRYSTSPGSAVLFTSSLFAILLVYLREDVPQTRRMIYGIVFANVMLTLLSLITNAQMKSGIAINLLQIPKDFFQIDPRIFMAGTLVLFCDSLLVIVLYEFLFSRARVLSLFPRIVAALLAVVYFDSIVFSFLSFWGRPIFWTVLGGQLIGKTISGTAFGTLLFVYLRYVDEAKSKGAQSRDFHDVFSILTYRERYEQIRSEKEEQAQRHQEAIRESDQRYRWLFDGSHDAIVLVSEETFEILRANPATASLFQRDVTGIVGQTLSSLIDDVAQEQLEPGRRELPEFREITIKRPDGTVASVELVGSSHTEQGQRMFQYYFRDVTARKRAEQQLTHDAFHDRLTDLPNRALFIDRLERLFLQRQRRNFALVFLDLDRFKNVNDSLGHMVGDELLVAVGQRMLLATRQGDSIARLGGDEFAFIFDDIETPEDAYRAVQRIERLYAEPFVLTSNELTVSASSGIVIRSDIYTRPEEMLRDADTAMYRAKAMGRAQHVIFDETMRQRVVEFLSMESGLRGALSRSEIEVHYQPIFDLARGMIAGVEALARWQRGDRMVNPAEFIPIAEETGLIITIGKHVLETACVQASRWQTVAGRDLFVAVNLSARQFQTETLLETVSEALSCSNLAPRLLQFEITESILMDSTDRTMTTFEQLRQLGVTFAIDDFGTGWSSLSYLQKLPIDLLKIDRSFVADIVSAHQPAAIPEAIVSLARSLGLEVVAEGIETEAQLEKLRSLHCAFGQGYLLGRPVPASEFETLLKA